MPHPEIRPHGRSTAELLADADTPEACRAAVAYAMTTMGPGTLLELARTVAAIVRWEERQRKEAADAADERAPDTLRSER